jgi:hypothetical protein
MHACFISGRRAIGAFGVMGRKPGGFKTWFGCFKRNKNSLHVLQSLYSYFIT